MNENILKDKSIKQIKKAIEILEHHKTHHLPYDQYFQLMTETLSEVTIYTLNEMLDFSAEGYGLFRARSVKNDMPYSSVEDLWSKKPELVTDYGRCNNKNESRFYCSNFFLTCLVECRAKENSKWILAEYEPIATEKILTIPIGINEHIFKNRPNTPLNNDQAKKNRIIFRFIRDSFKKTVLLTDTTRYLKTIAITDFFFKSKEIQGKEACIMYPSVADYHQNVNFVFSSETAKRNLKIKKAYYLEVIKKEVNRSSRTVELKFIANGKVIDDKIVWSNNKEVHFKQCLKDNKLPSIT